MTLSAICFNLLSFPKRRGIAALPLSLIAVAALSAAGCGGGGASGGSSRSAETESAPPVAPVASVPEVPAPPAPASEAPGASRYVPNYVEQVGTLRRWPKTRLTVRVVEPEADLRDLKSKVRKAVALWVEALDNDLTVEFTDDPAADITMKFVLPAELGGQRVGRTNIVYQISNNAIISAEVLLDQTLTDDYMVQVTAHEFGHALGIDGHSQHDSDLMFNMAHLPATITDRDKNTLLWNYGPEAIAEASAKAEKDKAEKNGKSTQAAQQTATAESFCNRH